MYPTFLPLAVFAMLAATAAVAAESEPRTHHKAADARQALVLTPEEAHHVRLEMRAFLSGVQKIVTGASHDDMPVVAAAARELGIAAAHEVPAGLRRKLPMQFKHLGHATHEGFDDLARDAASMADANLALKQLGQVMGHCVSCHATYRIDVQAGGGH